MFPVEEFRDSLLRITGILNRLDVRYHLTGGAALIAYTEPRLTQDIDLVVDRNQLLPRFDEFVINVEQEKFTFEKTAVRTAISNAKAFQLLDIERILKIDVYPRELIAGELDRTVKLHIFEGTSVPVVALADLILSKLIWISRGSGKSRTDLRWLWQHSTDFEQKEIRSYAGHHGLTRLLDEVLGESDEIDL